MVSFWRLTWSCAASPAIASRRRSTSSVVGGHGGTSVARDSGSGVSAMRVGGGDRFGPCSTRPASSKTPIHEQVGAFAVPTQLHQSDFRSASFPSASTNA